MKHDKTGPTPKSSNRAYTRVRNPATAANPVVTDTLNNIIRAQHLFTKKEVRWLIKKHKLNGYFQVHKLISPEHLLLSFANYVEETTNQKRVPTVVGFASYVGVSLQYLKHCRDGRRDVKSFTLAAIAAKPEAEQKEIQTLMMVGKAALADRNYSDVVNLIFTKCEDILIDKALDANSKTNTRIAEFLMKNHFNYKDRVEQTVTSHQTIKLVNDLTVDPEEHEVDAQNIDLNFLTGEQNDG